PRRRPRPRRTPGASTGGTARHRQRRAAHQHGLRRRPAHRPAPPPRTRRNPPRPPLRRRHPPPPPRPPPRCPRVRPGPGRRGVLLTLVFATDYTDDTDEEAECPCFLIRFDLCNLWPKMSPRSPEMNIRPYRNVMPTLG